MPPFDDTPRPHPLKNIFLVIAGTVIIALLLFSTRKDPERKTPPVPLPHVQVKLLERESQKLKIHTQGTVTARTESALFPQVSGRVLSVAKTLRNGSFFEEGDELLKLDASDYETALMIAKGDLARAELVLEQEKARAIQAKEDWERLGKGEIPSPLVLRIPQLREAEALTQAAKSKVEQADRNLERTKILAPYSGRVLKKNVDVGQYVSPNTNLAHIYSVDAVEIRLPLTSEQVALVDLPEEYLEKLEKDATHFPKVILKSSSKQATHTWEGKVVRTEGAIDQKSRQLFVIAEVIDPYSRKNNSGPTLKVGQFLEAEIEGRILKNVIVIPRATLREGREVIIINEKDEIERREVEVLWDSKDLAAIGKGVKPGERLCLTMIPYAVPGTKVLVMGSPNSSNDKKLPGDPVQHGKKSTGP